jgi:ABC-type amino acid transport substrate-binding protein
MTIPAVVEFVALLISGLIALRFVRWRRVFQWSAKLFKGHVDDKTPTKFSEWVSFAGFLITIVGLFISWITVGLQNRKATLEARSKEFTDQIASLQQHLQSASYEHRDFGPQIDIHLTTPVRDLSVIGNRVNFEWQFAKHSDLLSYLIEVVKKDQQELPVRITPVESCDFSHFRTCRFFANAPESQSSQLMMSDSESGDYLWRVVPAKKRFTSHRVEDEENIISDWSEYGSFSFYSSLDKRVITTKNVLVGTTSSVNLKFSSLDTDGNHQGYDIDLIRLLVEGCLSVDGKVAPLQHNRNGDAAIIFDDDRCDLAERSYTHKGYVPDQHQLRVIFKSFPSVAEGLDAVSRKEIDVFVGSLTKAQERENDALIFTDGYCSFDSALYAHAAGEEQLGEWLKIDRQVGVIDNSTNHWLATLLAAEFQFPDKLTIVAFPSFPALLSAFERREVDGVLVDDVLSEDLYESRNINAGRRDVYRVRGLDETPAWQAYLARLGAPREQFAIAVARNQPRTTPHSKLVGWIFSLFNLDLLDFQSRRLQTGLYEPLQLALHSHQIFQVRERLQTFNHLETGQCLDGRRMSSKNYDGHESNGS